MSRGNHNAGSTVNPDAVVVGEIVGKGDDAYRPIVVEGWEFRQLLGAGDRELRYDHREVGKRLGYKRLDSFTDLVEAHFKAGFINPFVVLGAKPETKKGGRPARVFMLNRDEIVYLIGKAETAEANRLMLIVARRFNLAMDALRELAQSDFVRGIVERALAEADKRHAADLAERDRRFAQLEEKVTFSILETGRIGRRGKAEIIARCHRLAVLRRGEWGKEARRENAKIQEQIRAEVLNDEYRGKRRSKWVELPAGTPYFRVLAWLDARIAEEIARQRFRDAARQMGLALS